jgi:hypothetical protein
LIDVLSEVIKWVKQAMDWIKQFIDAIGRIKIPDIKLPSLPFGLGVPTAELATASQFGASQFNSAPSSGGANFIFNITGDPVTIERTVISALRTYSRRNGVPIAGIG